MPQTRKNSMRQYALKNKQILYRLYDNQTFSTANNYTSISTNTGTLNYICPICENEEHEAVAKYCKICGTTINNI